MRQKILRDRPGSLSDGCYLSATNLVHQTLTDPGTGACGAAYPVASNPRMVAGEGLTMTALKCNLQPLNFASYGVTFTAAEKHAARAGVPQRRLQLRQGRRRLPQADRAVAQLRGQPDQRDRAVPAAAGVGLRGGAVAGT